MHTLTVTGWEIIQYDHEGVPVRRPCYTAADFAAFYNGATGVPANGARPAAPSSGSRARRAEPSRSRFGDGHVQPAVPVRVDAASVGAGKICGTCGAPRRAARRRPPRRHARGRAGGSKMAPRMPAEQAAGLSTALDQGRSQCSRSQEARRSGEKFCLFLLISWPSCKSSPAIESPIRG